MFPFSVVHPKTWNIEADPAGKANTKMVATIINRPARGGLSWIPLEPPACSGCDFPVDTAGVADVETFVKMAASAEPGDRPRSSVHWQAQYKVRNGTRLVR